MNVEVLKKYRNWSAGLVLCFGQHSVIGSDIQLNNCREQRNQNTVPWRRRIPFIGTWLLKRQRSHVSLWCGNKNVHLCLYIRISAYMRVWTWMVKSMQLLDERMKLSTKEKLVIISDFHTIELIFLCSFCCS